MKKEEIFQLASDYLATNKIDEVLALLSDNIQEEQQSFLVLLSARFSEWKKNQILGISSIGEDTDINKIRYGLAQLINSLKQDDLDQLGFDPISRSADFSPLRKKKLKSLINSATILMAQWEEKLDISENPNEEKRCEIEIKRLKNRLENYWQEYRLS